MQNKDPKNKNSIKNLAKNFLIVFFVFIAIASFISLYTEQNTSKKEEIININTLVNQIKNEEIESIIVRGDNLEIKLKNGDEKKAKKEFGESLFQIFKNLDVPNEKIEKISIEIKNESGIGFWAVNILPFALPFILVGVIIYFMMRQVQGANKKVMMFGQSKANNTSKEKLPKINFTDVAGAKEAKDELMEIVEFLKNPKKFTDLGAKIPKGVLLLGAPGTGKTLLARATAGEAKVPFFYTSGSEFVEMFVGVGAARVRDLFTRAKKASPSILFVDEIDAVGRRRGAGLGGSHDEREQTLNQILVEMDGFEDNTNVIIVAATNRPDVLDPALLRPGRFDRRVIIDTPDINDREAILKVHARKKPLAKNIDLRRIAEQTPGFTGADLMNLLNEAAILTARRDKKKIEMSEILESIEKVLLGPERKGFILNKKEKKITAYHEAGHALVAKMLPNPDPVHKISIISRGRAAGYTLKMPDSDKKFSTKSKFVDEMAVLLAGYAAEKKIFGEITTGATNDLKTATNLAKRLITEFGMAENLPPRTFGEREEMIFLGREIHEQRDYSDKIAEEIDKEIANFISNALLTAEKVLENNKEKLEKIVKILLEKETIDKDNFNALFEEKK